MNSIVPQDYWDKSYENLPLTYNPNRIMFKDLFGKYLPKGGNCLEIGCYPGDYLVYFGKNFEYTVSGIDTSRFVLDRLPAKMADYEVKVGEFFHGDFQKFKFKNTYDLVCSFGFIEHFLNFEDIIQKHIDLINSNGTLVLACPYFRKLQFVLHYILDSDNLKRHNTHAMNLKRWEKVIENNGMRVTYQGFYQTAGFWTDNPGCSVDIKRLTQHVIRLTDYLNSKVNYSNAFLSPYLIIFAKKDK